MKRFTQFFRVAVVATFSLFITDAVFSLDQDIAAEMRDIISNLEAGKRGLVRPFVTLQYLEEQRANLLQQIQDLERDTVHAELDRQFDEARERDTAHAELDRLFDEALALRTGAATGGDIVQAEAAQYPNVVMAHLSSESQQQLEQQMRTRVSSVQTGEGILPVVQAIWQANPEIRFNYNEFFQMIGRVASLGLTLEQARATRIVNLREFLGAQPNSQLGLLASESTRMSAITRTAQTINRLVMNRALHLPRRVLADAWSTLRSNGVSDPMIAGFFAPQLTLLRNPSIHAPSSREDIVAEIRRQCREIDQIRADFDQRAAITNGDHAGAAAPTPAPAHTAFSMDVDAAAGAPASPQPQRKRSHSPVLEELEGDLQGDASRREILHARRRNGASADHTAIPMGTEQGHDVLPVVQAQDADEHVQKRARTDQPARATAAMGGGDLEQAPELPMPVPMQDVVHLNFGDNVDQDPAHVAEHVAEHVAAQVAAQTQQHLGKKVFKIVLGGAAALALSEVVLGAALVSFTVPAGFAVVVEGAGFVIHLGSAIAGGIAAAKPNCVIM